MIPQNTQATLFLYHVLMGRFDDRATRPQRGPLDILRWKLGGPGPADSAGFRPPRRENDGALVRAPEASLTWVGHASFLLRLGGRLVALDPIWSSRIGGTVPRLAPPGVRLEDAGAIDIVCVTHNHMDHMDLPTLRRIGPAALYVVPLGCARFVEMPRVVELDWWQSHTDGDLTITLVPSRHWSMRMPWTRNDSLWGGFVVRGPEGCAYHSGDTAMFDGFVEIGRRLGPIDWAMLPIGAYEPRWFMQAQHVNPEEAGQAFCDLAARTLVAMHWATFRLTDEPLGEPPDRIRRFFAERGLDDRRLWLLDIGESRRLS
jgi:L-ascorbate metabolism protein UlaG (beta-lactamase superfamily)